MVRNIQYTSIKRVLDNLLDHPLLRDVDLDLVIRYTLRFIALHGYPQLYQDKIADIKIHQFRGELPCDLISIDQVRDKCSGICLRSMTKTFNPGLRDKPQPHKSINKFPDLVNGNKRHMAPPPYADGMDRYHDHYHHHDCEMSFKTLGRVIYTSFPEGIVEIAYKSIPVDEEGYPLLIDDENYLAALEAYIKVRVFKIKFETSKIPAAVLQSAQEDYAWLSAQLMDTFTIPSVSEMESITRMWNTLVPNRDEFSRQFKQLSREETNPIYSGAYPVTHGVITVKHETAKQDEENVNSDSDKPSLPDSSESDNNDASDNDDFLVWDEKLNQWV